jgi:hypothetical protein
MGLNKNTPYNMGNMRRAICTKMLLRFLDVIFNMDFGGSHNPS